MNARLLSRNLRQRRHGINLLSCANNPQRSGRKAFGYARVYVQLCHSLVCLDAARPRSFLNLFPDEFWSYFPETIAIVSAERAALAAYRRDFPRASR